ncbi:MAG: GAF domain-containing protein [Fimbriimonas ginsengisoli]|uniref:GAF domain-containing protein n=1 Tax=Fimbriimonas ginsengisoli TaxID=1005039 RepID=A0A931LU35_FIMGI|nr:GAF domain-containing protein [Fimbriimonas ginsengisoli]
MIDPARAKQILDAIRASALRGEVLRREAMSVLATLSGYDWSGIYSLEGGELVLDAFVGEPTEHTRIAVGRGVCGVAVSEGRNQVVEDVRTLDNYLACSLSTRSEIVVLIRRDGRILGQIDIDGHTAGAFDGSDEAFLEQLGALLAERWD